MKTIRIIAAAAVTVGLWGGVFAPRAAALPGQCFYTPWGGFCDGGAWEDGSFNHCQSGLGFTSCYQACHDPISGTAVPTDMDPRTAC